MKIAVIKLGARIHDNEGVGNSTNEVLSTIKMLTKGGVTVDVYTKVLKKDRLSDLFISYNIEDEYGNINSRDYDALMVLNGNVNFFGGAEDKSQILNYTLINSFKGKVVYMLYDPLLLLKQLWPAIHNKEWASNWNEKDIVITRNDIKYITQCKNLDPLYDKGLTGMGIAKYFPLEKFPLLTSEEYVIDFDNVEWDLRYAGTWRGGRRQRSLIEFFFGLPEDISVQLFGNLKIDQFSEKKVSDLRLPEFGSSVTHEEAEARLKKALSTVVIGDEFYIKTNDVAQRSYESIILGNITFMDSRYDYEKRIFSDPELKKFLYVDDRIQLADRIYQLKKDTKFASDLALAQKKDVAIDLDEYCNDFVRCIKEI